MSGTKIDTLCELWKASLVQFGGRPPFLDHADLYNTIDHIEVGGVGWQSFTMQYSDEHPDTDVPSWMDYQHDIFFRDPKTVVEEMLANPDFVGEIDFAPLKEIDSANQRRFQNFMSGDWVWNQAVRTPATELQFDFYNAGSGPYCCRRSHY